MPCQMRAKFLCYFAQACNLFQVRVHVLISKYKKLMGDHCILSNPRVLATRYHLKSQCCRSLDFCFIMTAYGLNQNRGRFLSLIVDHDSGMYILS